MNEHLLWRLLTASGGLRLVILCVALFIMLAAGWLMWGQMLRERSLQLSQQQQQLRIANRELRTQLIQLPALHILNEQLNIFVGQEASLMQDNFSLTALLAVSQGTLQYWKPGEQEQQMAVKMDWSQAVPLLTLLAQQRPAAKIVRLSVQPTKEGNYVELHLSLGMADSSATVL